MVKDPEEWYFDVKRGVAVPASERGHADDMLGPYPSKVGGRELAPDGRRRATTRGTPTTSGGSDPGEQRDR